MTLWGRGGAEGIWTRMGPHYAFDTTSFHWAEADRPPQSEDWSHLLSPGSLPLWVPLGHQLGPRKKGGERESNGNLVSQEKDTTDNLSS